MRIHTILLLVVLSCLMAGCKSPSASSADGGTIALTNDRYDPDAMTVPGWLNPKTLQVNSGTVAPEDGDMVIRGDIRGWHFTPSGNIEGALHPVPSRATPDECWLVLSNRTLVYREEGATAPEEPHLNGKFDIESGLFYPSSKIVLGQ